MKFNFNLKGLASKFKIGNLGGWFESSDTYSTLYQNDGIAKAKLKIADATESDDAVTLGQLPDEFYISVGTNGDYATIQLALAAGKYNLKLISNVTETVDWGVHAGKVITIIGDTQERTINMSVANTSGLTVYVDKVNFSITGTNAIFAASTIIGNKFKITGDASANIFATTNSYVSANYLEINFGTNNILIQTIWNTNYIYTTGNGSLSLYIKGSIGIIQNGCTATALKLDIFSVVINHIYGNEFTLYVRGNVVVNLCAATTNIQIAAGDKNIFNNFTNIKSFASNDLFDYYYYFYNCIFTGTTITIDHSAKNINSCKFVNLTVSSYSANISNCILSGNLIVSGDNNNINDIQVTGTLTVSSGADGNTFISPRVVGTFTITSGALKTNIISPRTTAAIVDGDLTGTTNIIAPQLI